MSWQGKTYREGKPRVGEGITELEGSEVKKQITTIWQKQTIDYVGKDVNMAQGKAA